MSNNKATGAQAALHAGKPGYFTYRVTNLAKSITDDDVRNLFSEVDRNAITKVSLGDCPQRPNDFSVGTVTFKNEPSFVHEFNTNNNKTFQYNVSGGDAVLVDDQFFGLTPLNRVNGKTRADLIAITGLAGRAFESWQNRAGQMWLRDYLPLELADCRAFVYGYPSKARRTQSEASIHDFTEGFMQELTAFRSLSEEPQTPIILIGHSLGCVVIKQAIVESVSVNTHVFPLHRYICGVIFFGAPHRGLHNPELQELVKGTPPEGLVRDLLPNSSLLASLNQAFPDACKDTKIISCYETEHTKTRQLEDPNDPNSKWVKTGPARFMVPPSSARLYWTTDRETPIAVHADHSEMAKLNDLPGSPYHQVKSEVTRILEGAPALMKSRKASELASQDVLSLFFVFQYECSFLQAWERRSPTRSSRYTFLKDIHLEQIRSEMIPTVPYGHPAYPTITELGLVLEQLSDLLESHRVTPASRSERTNYPESSLLLSSNMALLSAFKLEHEEIQPNNGQSEVVYELDKWSVSDRRQFSYLLQKFRGANEVLSHLSPHKDSLDLLASSSTMDKLPPDATTVDRTEGISRINQIYESLGRRALWKKQYNQGAPERHKSTLKFPMLKIKVVPEAGSSHYRKLSTNTNMSPDSSGDAQWVLVEWRSYQQAQDLKSQREAEQQALQLAYELSIARGPPLSRTLRCAGFVQEVTGKQFGFLFELPSWIDVTKAPVTLHALLVDDNLAPTFTQRIRLARDLAFSVAELHGVGILHKRLHSGNVLFFQPRFAESIDFDTWFLGGFEVSRHDQENQLSLDPKEDLFDVYKHPELHDESNRVQGRPGSERRHDVYSLGLMLLEIGLWRRLDAPDMQKPGHSPANNAKRFFTIANKFLPRNVGDKYCEAVLSCLDRTKRRLSRRPAGPSTALTKSNEADDDERGGVSLQLFVEHVIQRLESCHCRD